MVNCCRRRFIDTVWCRPLSVLGGASYYLDMPAWVKLPALHFVRPLDTLLVDGGNSPVRPGGKAAVRTGLKTLLISYY